MRIVLDSNIIRRDPKLAGYAWQFFLNNHIRAGYKLCIPLVVYDEVLNINRRELLGDQASIQAALGNFERRTGRKLTNPATDDEIEDLASLYRSLLDSQLKAVNAAIVPYPDVVHDILARRARLRRKPFDDKGRGYRDALIWENILGLARVHQTDHIVFITDNDSDFGQSKVALHLDLLEDLKELGVEPGLVTLIPSLDSFNEKYVTPTLEMLSGIASQLSAGNYAGLNLSGYIREHLAPDNVLRELSSEELALPKFFDAIDLRAVADVSSIGSVDVRRLNPDTISITCTAMCRGLFEFQFPKYANDLLSAAAKTAMVITDLSEYLSLGSIALDAQIDVSLIYEESAANVLAVDVPKVRLNTDIQWLDSAGMAASSLAEANVISLANLVAAITEQVDTNSLVSPAFDSMSTVLSNAVRSASISSADFAGIFGGLDRTLEAQVRQSALLLKALDSAITPLPELGAFTGVIDRILEARVRQSAQLLKALDSAITPLPDFTAINGLFDRILQEQVRRSAQLLSAITPPPLGLQPSDLGQEDVTAEPKPELSTPGELQGDKPITPSSPLEQADTPVADDSA